VREAEVNHSPGDSLAVLLSRFNNGQPGYLPVND